MHPHPILQFFDDIETTELLYVPRPPRRIADPSSGRTFGWTQWRAPKQPLAERYNDFKRLALRTFVRPELVADVADYINSDRDGRLALRAKYAGAQ